MMGNFAPVHPVIHTPLDFVAGIIIKAYISEDVNVLSVPTILNKYFDLKKFSLKMASKKAYVALHPPTFLFLHAWNAVSLLPSPDIQHLTPPGCHLCIGIHVCMLTLFIIFRKFRLWIKKKRL